MSDDNKPSKFTTREGKPLYKNPDSSYSSERSITVTDPSLNGGRATNIPSFIGGKQLNQRDAINAAVQSGKKHQSFNSVDEAVSAAKARSKNIGKDLKRDILKDMTRNKK